MCLHAAAVATVEIQTYLHTMCVCVCFFIHFKFYALVQTAIQYTAAWFSTWSLWCLFAYTLSYSHFSSGDREHRKYFFLSGTQIYTYNGDDRKKKKSVTATSKANRTQQTIYCGALTLWINSIHFSFWVCFIHVCACCSYNFVFVLSTVFLFIALTLHHVFDDLPPPPQSPDD